MSCNKNVILGNVGLLNKGNFSCFTYAKADYTRVGKAEEGALTVVAVGRFSLVAYRSAYKPFPAVGAVCELHYLKLYSLKSKVAK